MSFSDIGRKTSRESKPKTPSAPVGSGSSASTGKGGLGQVSESLLQYQRNVGILENIVQSLLSKRGISNHEYEVQYRAQVDVITQLEAKLNLQLQQKHTATGNERTTWVKLQRDFERVQLRASQLQESVNRMQSQAARLKAAHDKTESAQDDPHASYEYQQQLQLEEDRLNEEIMREREEEIRKINRGMHQVNEIYKDLAHIVGSQQEQIDNIETQMEESRVNAEAGLKQVEKANEKFGQQCTIS